MSKPFALNLMTFVQVIMIEGKKMVNIDRKEENERVEKD